jgi:hypothetical protein
MNKRFSFSLSLGLALVVALPVAAATRDSDGDVTSVISRPMIYRDSDGDVTSVVKRPIYYRDSDGDVISVIYPIWLDDIRVLYRFDAAGSPGAAVPVPVAEIAKVLDTSETSLASGSATTIRSGGRSYLVEARDSGLKLQDLTSGEVYLGQPVRQVVRNGRVMQANPKSFALD